MSFYWKFQNEQLYVCDPLDGDPSDPVNPATLCKLCEQVEIIRKIVDLKSGFEQVEIGLHMPYKLKKLIVDRSELGENKIIKTLTNLGLSLPDNYETALVIKSVLVDTEAKAPVEFTHDMLGFHEWDGQLGFCGHYPIGGCFSPQELTSTYKKSDAMEPRGTLEEWVQFIQNNVAPSTELSLALMLSATAPVAFLLRREAVFTELPIWGMIGHTTTGKTTALYLMASMWGDPLKMTGSLNATANAFAAMLQEKNGIPFLADEATHSPQFDWDQLLYSLPAGTEKRRCDGDGNLRPVVTFSGAMIVTSETSILARTHGYAGQAVRIMEFTHKWFEEGYLADAAKRFCLTHYGTGYIPFIQLLLSDGFSAKLKERYLAVSDGLTRKYGAVQGEMKRLIQRIALILVSGWALQLALDIRLSLKGVADCLKEKYDESSTAIAESGDPADKLYKAILSYIVQHLSRFPQKDHLNKALNCSDIQGARGVYKQKQCVWILEDVFDDIVKNKSDFASRSAVKALGQKGYLIHQEKDRYLDDVVLGTIKSKCYCVNLLSNTLQTQPLKDCKTLPVKPDMDFILGKEA